MSTITTEAGFRLVHDDKQVIVLFEAEAGLVTETIHNVFIGTEAECRAEITRLGLTPLPAPEEVGAGEPAAE